jgi:hypothetical protein
VPKAATTDQTGSHLAGMGWFSGCISDDVIGGFMELVLGDYEWFEVVAKVFEIERFHVGHFAHVVVFSQNHGRLIKWMFFKLTAFFIGHRASLKAQTLLRCF